MVKRRMTARKTKHNKFMVGGNDLSSLANSAVSLGSKEEAYKQGYMVAFKQYDDIGMPDDGFTFNGAVYANPLIGSWIAGFHDGLNAAIDGGVNKYLPKSAAPKPLVINSVPASSLGSSPGAQAKPARKAAPSSAGSKHRKSRKTRRHSKKSTR